MIAVAQRFALFLVGAVIGAQFGFVAFLAQDDRWVRFDWRNFVIPPTLVLGLLSAWLGKKPLQGTWCSILLGTFAGAILGVIGGLFVAWIASQMPNIEREVRGMVGFIAVLASLPLGMLIGGIAGGRLGKKRRETHRPNRPAQ